MTLIETANQIQSAIDNAIVGCDMTTREGKAEAMIACLDLFAQWRDEELRAYIAATEDPGFDLSPAAFTSRNHRISVQ